MDNQPSFHSSLNSILSKVLPLDGGWTGQKNVLEWGSQDGRILPPAPSASLPTWPACTTSSPTWCTSSSSSPRSSETTKDAQAMTRQIFWLWRWFVVYIRQCFGPFAKIFNIVLRHQTDLYFPMPWFVSFYGWYLEHFFYFKDERRKVTESSVVIYLFKRTFSYPDGYALLFNIKYVEM